MKICKNCKSDLPEYFVTIYTTNGFCDEICFKKDPEYFWFKRNLDKLWSSLNDMQKLDLWSLWDNGIFEEPMYEKMLDEVIVRPEIENVT